MGSTSTTAHVSKKWNKMTNLLFCFVMSCSAHLVMSCFVLARLALSRLVFERMIPNIFVTFFSSLTVTDQRNEVVVTFVQREQMDWSIAVLLNHAFSFLQYSRDAEVLGVYLISFIASLLSGANTNKVNDAAPVISQI